MTRDDFPHLLRIETRWMDNDVYGHVNNATYYSFFDTAVNRHLLDAGVLDLEGSPVFGVVVETGCRYLSPSHPQPDLATTRPSPRKMRDLGRLSKGFSGIAGLYHRRSRQRLYLVGLKSFAWQ